MIDVIGQSLGALLLAFVLASGCVILAWAVFYACVIASHNKHNTPEKFKGVIQDYLVDFVFLQLGKSFIALILAPVTWAFRTGSAIVQYSLSHWKMIILSSLIVWAGTGVSDHTQTVLSAIDYTYTHYLAGALNVIKQFANVFRIALDLATPVWNLFWYVMRRVPIDTLESSIECAGPYLKLTFTELGVFTMSVVRALSAFILRPGVPLNLVDAFYNLQTWATGTVELVGCYCKDLQAPADTLATLITAPPASWAASNFTSIPVTLLISVPANATGPPAKRPDFDPFFDAIIDFGVSWSQALDAFFNAVATFLVKGQSQVQCQEVNPQCVFNVSKPAFGCGGVTTSGEYLNPDCPLSDCYFDGRDKCVYWYIFPVDYFIGKTNNIDWKVPLPFTDNNWQLKAKARWYKFPVYAGAAIAEAAKVLVRTLIHIDELRPSVAVNGTTTTPLQKAAYWDASHAFAYWRESNTVGWGLLSWLVDTPAVPNLIRFSPRVWMMVVDRWIFFFKFIYDVAVNTIVGVVDAAEGILPLASVVGALDQDWKQDVIEPAHHLCNYTGFALGNTETQLYPTGCLGKYLCSTIVNTADGLYNTFNYALRGGTGSCTVQDPVTRAFITRTPCWEANQADLFFMDAIESWGNAGACLPNLLGMWLDLDHSDGSFTLDDVNGNCLWTRTQTQACDCSSNDTECCTATSEDVEIYTHTVLSTYPQSSDGDFWQRKCTNSTTCILQEFGSEYTRFVTTQRRVEAHMKLYGLTAEFDPLTCSLYNVGAATYECRSQLVCAAPTCSQVQVQGQDVVTEEDVGTTCGTGETVCPPCLANCPTNARWPAFSECPTCGRSFLNPQMTVQDKFAPWVSTSGWKAYVETWWTGCVPMECASAAASFALDASLQACINMPPSQAQAAGSQCALVAACTSSFLLVELEEMTEQCDNVGVNSTDACVDTPVNLKNPACNLGAIGKEAWAGLGAAVFGLFDVVISTVGQSIYSKSLVLRWPEREANSIVCSVKSVTGTAVSVLLSVIYDTVAAFEASITQAPDGTVSESAAPQNAYYPSPTAPIYQSQYWPELNTLFNMHYIGAVFTNAGNLIPLAVDMSLEAFHTFVELIDAVAGPPFMQNNVPVVCNFGGMGGAPNSKGPDGKAGSGHQPVSGSTTSKMQQLLQCLSSSVFRIIEGIIQRVFVFAIGLTESFERITQYWTTGQFRFAVNGSNIKAGMSITNFNLGTGPTSTGDSAQAWCKQPIEYYDQSGSTPLGTVPSLCQQGVNVYANGGNGVWIKKGSSVVNIEAQNGCNCECMQYGACEFTDPLPYVCAQCMFKELKRDLVEVRFLIDAALQIVYWFVQIILDAISLVFGGGPSAEGELALAIKNFFSTLVAFAGVIAKIAWQFVLQIPLLGPFLQWMLETVICEWVIGELYNKFYAILYVGVCDTVTSICNAWPINWVVSHNCGWGDDPCSVSQVQCKSLSQTFGTTIIPSKEASSCTPANLNAGDNMCMGVYGDVSTLTCRNAQGEAVFCECDESIGQTPCCNTTSTVPSSGVCDEVSLQCICKDDSAIQPLPKFSECNSVTQGNWLTGGSCAAPGAYCRILNSAGDLLDLAKPCSECQPNMYARYCEAGSNICACMQLPLELSECPKGTTNEQALANPVACTAQGPPSLALYYVSPATATNEQATMYKKWASPFILGEAQDSIDPPNIGLKNIFIGPGPIPAPPGYTGTYDFNSIWRAFGSSNTNNTNNVQKGAFCASLTDDPDKNTYSWIGAGKMGCVFAVDESDLHNIAAVIDAAYNKSLAEMADKQYSIPPASLTRTMANTFVRLNPENTDENYDLTACVGLESQSGTSLCGYQSSGSQTCPNSVFADTDQLSTAAAVICRASRRRMRSRQLLEEVPASPVQQAWAQFTSLNVTFCASDVDCTSLSPPARCNYGNEQRFCDSCPRPRTRSCVDGMCACTPNTTFELGMYSVPQLAAAIEAVPWDGDSLCDDLMRMTESPIFEESPIEYAMRKNCLRLRQTAYELGHYMKIPLPIDSMYNGRSLIRFVVDMLRGGLVQANLGPNATMFDTWRALRDADIDPIQYLAFERQLRDATSKMFSSDNLHKIARLFELHAGSTPHDTFKQLYTAASTTTRRTDKVLRRMTRPSKISAVMGGTKMLSQKGTQLLQHAHLTQKKKPQAPAPPAAATSVQLSVSTPTRQLRWVFPEPEKLNVSPNSSCFVIEFIAKGKNVPSLRAFQ